MKGGDRMNREQLIKWMEKHEIADHLVKHIMNVTQRLRRYEPFADLMTKGQATVTITYPYKKAGDHIVNITAAE